jgi:preprotein translocase subunit SecD
MATTRKRIISGSGLTCCVAIAVVALTLLSGCASSKTAAEPSTSAVKHDLQLRPVLTEAPIGSSTCPSAAHDENASTTPVAACSADGKTLYSLGAAAVSGYQVASVSDPIASSGGPPWQIEVALDSTGKAALATLTQDLVAKTPPQSQMAIYVHGRVRSAPTVMEPITAGMVAIACGCTQMQADQLVSDINSP